MTEYNPENAQWTLRLGKNIAYNPSPFKSREDFIIKTLVSIGFIALGILLLSIPSLPVQIIGGLTVGSMLACYILSVYETQLYDKQQRHQLR